HPFNAWRTAASQLCVLPAVPGDWSSKKILLIAFDNFKDTSSDAACLGTVLRYRSRWRPPLNRVRPRPIPAAGVLGRRLRPMVNSR
ncbi:MAG TPA: hypothetical protein VKD43_05945, partial [Xanthobacteraceae bacterium]|nr:hypothetical protein [Xanthobacteraceae bacterium]